MLQPRLQGPVLSRSDTKRGVLLLGAGYFQQKGYFQQEHARSRPAAQTPRDRTTGWPEVARASSLQSLFTKALRTQ